MVRQGMNILFGDYINMDNDLEVYRHLSDSDVFSSVRTVTSVQSSDEEEEQKCTDPPSSPRLHKH